MSLEDDFLGRITKALETRQLTSTDPLIGVSISQQRCYFFKSNLCRRVYGISTSRNPPSEIQDSGGTPRGFHEIVEKIGEDQPEGTVFRGRQPVGKHYLEMKPEERESNLITSRILWLQGLEPGTNQGPGVDSKERYIYFHGTNHEERIGKPFSGGCVEFTNADILELFRETPLQTLVYIEA